MSEREHLLGPHRVYTPNFQGVWCPSKVLENRDLSNNAKVVWLFLAAYYDEEAGGAECAIDYIGAKVNLGRSEFYDCLQALVDQGLATTCSMPGTPQRYAALLPYTVRDTALVGEARKSGKRRDGYRRLQPHGKPKRGRPRKEDCL